MISAGSDFKNGAAGAPFVSLELAFIRPDGKRVNFGMACTMDMSIVWELFTDCIDAARVLDTDKEFAAEL